MCACSSPRALPAIWSSRCAASWPTRRLAPIQAGRKVYILDRVDLLGVQAANAFLKTLEEPPADVVLILLARTRESVLPTIVSRCQVVPFRTIPVSEAAGIVVQNSGASPEQARVAHARPAMAPSPARWSS